MGTASTRTSPGSTYHGRHGMGESLQKVLKSTSIHLKTIFGSPGNYTLELECTTTNGNTYSTTDLLESYYVRRELRSLNDDDRDTLLDAIAITTTMSNEEGQRMYGENYRSLEYFEMMHLQKAGARKADKIHDGMGVVTQHISITQ